MLEPWAWQHKKWKKRPYWYLAERVHLQNAHRVLATSSLEAKNLTSFVGEEDIETIPLALTEDVAPEYERARQTLGWDSEDTVLLYLSRVHPKKGLHLLLEGMASGEPTYENVRIVVVGDGPDEYVERVQDLADRNRGQLPPIEWEGGVWGDRKWAYMQGADLFCLPTHSENFGLVVLEACQVGTPVLTTTGTPWTVLTEWNSGFLVEPTVPALQSAIQEYITSWTWTKEDRRRLARRTRARFDMSVVGPQYKNVYEKVIDENKACMPVNE
jgi:glycosyltransferase involved in cell wall biosynthesis